MNVVGNAEIKYIRSSGRINFTDRLKVATDKILTFRQTGSGATNTTLSGSIEGNGTIRLINTATSKKTLIVDSNSSLSLFRGTFLIEPANADEDTDAIFKLDVIDTDPASHFSVVLGLAGSRGRGQLDVGDFNHVFGSLTIGTDILTAGLYDSLSDFTVEQQEYLFNWNEGVTSITIIPELSSIPLLVGCFSVVLSITLRRV